MIEPIIFFILSLLAAGILIDSGGILSLSNSSHILNSLLLHIFCIILCCIAIFALWQSIRYKLYRRAIKKGNKRKIIKWYFRCNNYLIYFAFSLSVIASVPFILIELIIVFYLLYLFNWLFTQVPLESEIKKADRYLQDIINENSRIVIMQKASYLFPSSYIQKYREILKIRFKHQDNLVIARKNYIFVPEFLAVANRELLKGHDISYYCDGIYLQKIQKNIIKRRRLAKHGWDNLKLCDCIVVDHTKFTTEAFQNHSVKYISSPANLDTTEFIISSLTKDHGILQKMTESFEPVLSYEGTEYGKCFALEMILNTLSSPQSDTEYFYELLKLFEFITHYKCFADFDEKGNTLFSKPQDASLGILQNGCIERNLSPLLFTEEYNENVKYMFRLLTGSSSEVKKTNPAFYGRQILVTLRNRTIGHGAMAYAVSVELVEKLIVIVAALTHDFLLEKEPMQETLKLHNSFDKYLKEADGLYLLISSYDTTNSGKYLNYSNGNIRVIGKKLKINLCREAE